MRSARIDDVQYRNGDWGPGYLLQAETLAMGVVRLRPGDEIDNHIHRTCDESFVVLEGECTLWIDGANPSVMREGDIRSCAPGEMHHLVNESDAPCRFVFVKTPASPGDTIVVPWRPGEPVPAVPAD